MPFDHRFRPRLWAFALTLGAVVGAVSLGHWQAQRAESRRSLAAEQAAGQRAAPLALPAAHAVPVAAFVNRRVLVRGTFLPEHTILLDNRQRSGRVGYEIATPLRIEDGPLHVLVLRGWLPAGPRRDVLPAVPILHGVQVVEGLALEHLAQRYAPKSPPPGARVWQNLSVEAVRAATGLALQPVLIQQHSGAADGLLRDWISAGSGAEKNEMYALQWYSLAGLAGVLFVVLSFRRNADPS